MSELSKVDRGDDTDTVKLSELLHGRHAKGIYFSWFVPGIGVNVFAIVVILSLVSLGFQKLFFIHEFVLQLFLLDQPYLLYNSYLV